MRFRSGIGYDAHAIADGYKMILGGVEIPFEKGIKGHSDGDTATHAICDALLGATNLGDIGQYFPSSDSTIEGISSLVLLEEVVKLVRENGFSIENIDCTIILQQPKIASYLHEMKQNLASVCGISMEKISVKATTTDHLGFIGRGEGVAAMATASITY